MNNPFRFEEPVTDDFFAGREDEISEMVKNARSSENTAILGERRVGKSSLLAETARRHAKEFVFVKVDTRAIADENQFLDCFTRQVIRAGVGKARSIEPALMNLLSTKRMRDALSTDVNLATDGARPEAQNSSAPESATRRSSASDEKTGTGIRMCPRCGRPLKWLENYGRHFCYDCKKYAPVQRRRPRDSDGEHESPDSRDSCPRCRSTMTYVHRYSDYYCTKCGHYPHIGKRIVPEPWSKGDMMAALDLPQMLSELKGKPVVVMLDNIPETEELSDGRVLEAMRQKFEEHDDATYVFTGNADETMRLLFEDRNGALYKFAKPLELNKIPDAEMERFMVSRFRSSGGRLPEEAAQKIVGVSEGIPGYAQQIGHELFHISHTPEMSDVDLAIRRTVRLHSIACSMLWDSIRSPLHRRYLFAVAREPQVPHGEAFIRRYNLRSRSHVQRIESQLEARGIIRHGEIVDPMFVMWLRRPDSG